MDELTDILYDILYDYDDEDWEYDLPPWQLMRRKGYGFIYIKNPKYPLESDREYLTRKPTPKERREIVINTVIECNGRTFKIPVLAAKLSVSDRTLQTILRHLEKDGLIQITPKYNKQGRQVGNAYKYIGPPCESYGTGLTLKDLYDINRDVGFRDWAWRSRGFAHDQHWYNIYPTCKSRFERRIARKEYLKEKGLPLVIPDDTKYIVLRYAYWKGDRDVLTDYEFLEQNRTKKFALEPLNRTETIDIFGVPIIVKINGPKENPHIKLIDGDTNKRITTFTWFDENVVSGVCDIDEETVEQILILGDFTTR